MNRIQFILSLSWLPARPWVSELYRQTPSWSQTGTFTNPAIVLHRLGGHDNHCYPYGTMAVAGAKGYGRSFNGMNDYMVVGSPRLLDFTASHSSRIDFSFKTDSSEGTILRKGSTFSPGYMIAVRGGHLEAIVGYMEEGTTSDLFASIISTQRVDDNSWHRASMIRDRESHKLLLLMDNTPAASPVDDNVSFALINNSSFTIGRGAELSGSKNITGATLMNSYAAFLPGPERHAILMGL